MANVSISGLRRNIKNVAHNYTDAQVKVREATSNDPWGPSSTQMSEIADLTYNMVAFSEIMQMIWKRLNDHGKNWRHVYKALVLLEYLIKTGSEKVAQQCKENIFAIQTLKDFQFVEENKDQGLNVREKAKAMVALLKDEERLKNERVRALKAKERFAQSTAGIGSDTAFSTGHTEQDQGSPLRSPGEDPLKPDIELARPQTQGEEELQLQLALAMSREEADAEATKAKSDDMRLTLALQKSKEELPPAPTGNGQEKTSAINDLLDIGFGPNPPQRTAASLDPWSPLGESGGAEGGSDPWGGIISQNNIPDPWGGIGAVGVPPSRASPIGAGAFNSPPQQQQQGGADPWGPGGGGEEPAGDPWGVPSQTSVSPNPSKSASADPFSPQESDNKGAPDLMAAFGGQDLGGNSGPSPQNVGGLQSNPWDLSGLDPMGPGMGGSDLLGNNSTANTGAKPKKIVESLLGEHSNLVNLDNLVQPKSGGGSSGSVAKNPFADQPNPFQAAAAPKPTINQLRTGGQPPVSSPWPDQQQNNKADINPFF